MSFQSATNLSGAPGQWTAEVAEGWDIFGVTNGGYLMAIATRAMGRESNGRTLISANGTFINPATPGPVNVKVEELKEGRSLSTLVAVMSRNGMPLVHVTGVFADPDRPRHDAFLASTGPPELPDPENSVPVQPSQDAPLPPPFTGKIQLRVPPEDASIPLDSRGDLPRARGWFRLRGDEELDSHAVVLAADAFPPAIFYSSLGVGWTPTVDLAVQVRDPAPTGWLACEYRTRFIGGGLLEEDGEIWDQSGNLVALSRQLALVPR